VKATVEDFLRIHGIGATAREREALIWEALAGVPLPSPLSA